TEAPSGAGVAAKRRAGTAINAVEASSMRRVSTTFFIKFLLALLRTCDPETVGQVPHRGVVLIAARRADRSRVAFPRPAAQDMRGASFLHPRGAVGRRAREILVPAIGDPFVDA